METAKFDDTPRDEMRRQLLPEVNRVLAERTRRESSVEVKDVVNA